MKILYFQKYMFNNFIFYPIYFVERVYSRPFGAISIKNGL